MGATPNSEIYKDRKIRAGTPPTTVLAATSSTTTAPAATIEPSPTETPSKSDAFSPIQQSSPIVTGAEVIACRAKDSVEAEPWLLSTIETKFANMQCRPIEIRSMQLSDACEPI